MIPEDLWYIIPAKPVVNGTMGMIVLTPSVPGISTSLIWMLGIFLGETTGGDCARDLRRGDGVGLKGRMLVVSRWSLVVGYLWSGWSSS